MPVLKCQNGKYKIGTGPCVFDTQQKAQRAYRAYLFKKHGGNSSAMEGKDIPKHEELVKVLTAGDQRSLPVEFNETMTEERWLNSL